MKRYTSIKMIALCFLFFAMGITTSNAQANLELAEQRARSLHEAIKSSDNLVWEAYVKDNYSAQFLEKHEISKHVAMLERLHKDFSKSKILSVKKIDAIVSMVIEKISDKHKVIFELSVDEMDEDKVNGVSIEAGELK